MIKALTQIKAGLIKLLEWTVILLMGGLVLDVLWQVLSRALSRYGWGQPSAWTDELATLLIIWVALLGSSVAFIKQSHLGVDYFVGKLPDRARRLSEIAVYILVAFFAASVLLLGGLKLVWLTLLTQQISPALGVKMGHVYLALPVSGVFIFLFALESVAERLGTGRSQRKGDRR